MSPLQAMVVPPLPPDDPRLLPSLPPMDDDGGRNDFLRQLLERDTQRMRGDAAQQMRDLDRISRTGPGAPEPIGELMPLPEEPNYNDPRRIGPGQLISEERPMTPPQIDYSDMPMGVMGGGDEYWRKGGIKDQQAERFRQWEISKGLRPPDNAPAPRLPLPTGDAPIKSPRDFAPKPIPGIRSAAPAPAPRAPAPRSPLSRREVMGDRREAARRIMDQYIAGPRRAMPAPRRAMPVAPRKPMVDRSQPQPYMGVNLRDVPVFKNGGKVSKGQAKVGKVMGEFKRGELHSGSKQGPLVTNPKQAKAIALSEARKAGAKIPKKAMGGRACG
jgi:hypothetical protein